MISNKRVVAVVPARGGSKSIPRKNLALLGGRSLVEWSIATGRHSQFVDRVLVSTDDPEIGAAATAAGAEVYWRPDELATDDALVITALQHVMRTLRSEGETAEILVLLEPTCPLRAVEDVDACVRLVADTWDSAATFCEAALHPHRAWRIVDGVPTPFIEAAVPWLPRQRLPPAYQLNGAVYAVRLDRLLASSGVGLLVGRTAAVVTPPERSVDIDTASDLIVAEAMLRERDAQR